MVERRKSSILLVDTDLDFRRVARETLISEGFMVLEISKVYEALATAKKVKFDLLITDPFLPFVLELVNSMAQINPEQRVLFLSDYSPGRVDNFGICPRGSEILQKPVSGSLLSERVMTLLSSGESWARLCSSWRGNSTRQKAQEEDKESSSLSEMA